MRYLKYSEDYQQVIIHRKPPYKWQYMLFNDSACSVFSPSGENLFTHRDFVAMGSLKGFDLFVRDEVTGKFWSIIKENPDVFYEKFICEYHLSYISIEVVCNNVHSQVILFVPERGIVESSLVSVTNLDKDNKKIKVFSFVEFTSPQNDSHMSIAKSNCFNEAYYSKDINSVIAYQRDNPFKKNETLAFIRSSLTCSGFDCNRRKVIGRTIDTMGPGPIRIGRTSNSVLCGGEMVGLIMNEIILKKNEEKTFSLLSGIATGGNREQVDQNLRALIDQYGAPDNLLIELTKRVDEEEKVYSKQYLSLPSKEVERYFNFWLKKEIIFNVVWSRLFSEDKDKWILDQVLSLRGYMYFSGQDKVNEHIRELFEEADKNGYFAGGTVKNIEFQLDFAELIFRYALFTKKAKFLCDENYWSYEKDLLQFVFEMLHSLGKSRGGHGLLKVDEMVSGTTSRSFEHVPVTIRFYTIINDYLGLDDSDGNIEWIRELIALKSEIAESLKQNAFNTEHFIYAFQENGSVVGGREDDGGAFFLRPQLLAILAGLTEKETVSQLQKKIERKLRTGFGYMSMIPAFLEYSPDKGWWTALPPGIGENGGISTSENILKFKVDCHCGDYRQALQTLKSIIPLTSYRIINQEKSLGEPYFVSEQTISSQHPKEEGYAQSGWQSGLAGLLYETMINNIVGINLKNGGLQLATVFDFPWTELHFQTQSDTNVFVVDIRQEGQSGRDIKKICVDGKEITESFVKASLNDNVKIDMVFGKNDLNLE